MGLYAVIHNLMKRNSSHIESNLFNTRRNIFIHTVADDKKIKNIGKAISKKLVIKLSDVVIEKEYENILDFTSFELPDFSHGYKNHIPLWQD